MPTFIKTGFWEKAKKGYKEWLNLDELIASKSASSGVNPFFLPDVISFGGTSCANIFIDPSDYYPLDFYSSKIEALNLITVNYKVNIYGGSNGFLTEVNFPSLTTVGGELTIQGWYDLTSVDISSLNEVSGNIYIQGNDVLESIIVSSSLSIPNGSVIAFDYNALNQSSVDAILSALVQGEVTNCNIDLSGGTNAAPSTQGLDDVDILIANGCTVTVN